MTGPPILVGVDGSEPSLAAVDLAIREGALRERTVRIVYGDCWADHPAWATNDPDGDVAADLLSEPQQAIRDATDRASATQVPITTEILAGDPAAVLIRESAHADLLVLGHRGRGGLPELLLGSVAIKVAAHATCPVLITRGTAPATGDILVGVDGSTADDAVLGFAFHEAALRGTELRVLHAANRSHLGNPESLLQHHTATESAPAQLLTDAVLNWSRKYPTVTTHQHSTTGRPADAILQAGANAQLVVLGARGHAKLAGRRLGSVTHAVLHHASCPVAVVQ
uniref:universal stress protein n=1 Tax=Paractinoplanes polyasparticus TaxID=2856853 RepID=UPI001C84A4F8|nr:universal stress protein [Actinoplanes polyasparticus]